MPLSIAERLHQLPHGAQAAVADALGVSQTTVSSIMRGVYPRPESAEALERLRAVQRALAAKFNPPRLVEEVFAEWDGPKTEQTHEAPRRRARAS